MNTTLSKVSRWDVTPIFWEADDFCRTFAQQSRHHPQLPLIRGERLCQSKLSRSEVMTMVIAFQGSGYRPFKEFPPLVSYNRFVKLMPWCLMLLCGFLYTRTGEMTGLAFINSPRLKCVILVVPRLTKCSETQLVGARTRWAGTLALSCI